MTKLLAIALLLAAAVLAGIFLGRPQTPQDQPPAASLGAQNVEPPEPSRPPSPSPDPKIQNEESQPPTSAKRIEPPPPQPEQLGGLSPNQTPRPATNPAKSPPNTAPAVPLEPAPSEFPAPPPSDSEFYARSAPAVVQIYCTTREEIFSASGVIVNEQGLILTNAHVAEVVIKSGASNCQARHGNPADPFAGLEIVFVASTTPKIPNTKVAQRDIAFLRLVEPRERFAVVTMELEVAPPGTSLLTLGYPSEFLQSVTASSHSNLVFSALSVDGYADVDGDLTTGEAYVFKGGLVLQQGSSGTALFKRGGGVVGLIFATTKGATTSEREGLAFTIGYINLVLELELGQALVDFIASH